MSAHETSRLKKRLVGALAAIGLLTLLYILYVLAAPEPVDLPPDRLSIPTGAGHEQLGVTLAPNLGAPRLEGNRVDELVNGDEIFPAMLAAIREARTSVNLLTYVYWKGAIAEQFADELSAAARRGVEVRVLLDAYGARKIDPVWVERMRAAGCHVEWFHPLRWSTLRRFNNRTHRKVMVVDGRVGFTGGVGIAQQWTGNAQDPDHWRDDHFRVEGPAVRYMQGSFADNWRRASGEVLAGHKMFPDLPPVGEAAVVPVDSAANERFSGIPLTYWLMFHSARQRILLATPYYVPDPDLELGLLEAARRGVQVTLLVPGPHQDSAIVRYASRTYYRGLLEAGVQIHEYQPTLMHTKVVVIDDAWSLVGSPNFDSRSLELNFEFALAVHDRSLARALSDSFADDLSVSRQVTLDEVEDWSVFARARNHLALRLREQL
ncbi:phospholipase D-like domain-containing protein [Lysobacter sp. A3-1-A15]|uniref:phospholipase D-like domain-containing protein n=1 Tax=Novilysobacter viscosus TaxID=3098602 RepID=UPI002ED97C13